VQPLGVGHDSEWAEFFKDQEIRDEIIKVPWFAYQFESVTALRPLRLTCIM